MRGKILIIVMLAVAAAAAGFAWWWNYERAARAREFWGPSAATIRFADKVEAFRIDLPDDPNARTYLHPESGGLFQYAGPPVDITGAPGLLNATTSLMSDDGFNWSTKPFTPKPSSEWILGVRFERESQRVTLLFSKADDAMLVAERGEAVLLSRKTAAGWRGYLEKQLEKGGSP
jgi:hypothetical protein